MRRAVLVIDIQQAILEGEARPEESGRALDAMVARVAGLLERARAAGTPIVYVQHNESAPYPLATGTPGWKIRAEIAPREGEPVIQKFACDSFFETDLDGVLKKLGAEELVVVGCMTHYCIDTTVRRAVSLGYDVVLASDGHMTADCGDLQFDQIIAHHNRTLNGFRAGQHQVRLKALGEL